MNVLPLQDYTYAKLYDKAFMSLIDKKWIEWFKYISITMDLEVPKLPTILLLTFFCAAQKEVHITPDNFGGLFKCTFKLAL